MEKGSDFFIEHALSLLGIKDLSSKGWSADERDILYAAAYGLYDRGDYTQAAELFTQLIFSFPFEEKYWRGLASSYQMEGKYEEALSAWSITALLVEEDPLPHFHAGECLLSLGEKEQALKAFLIAEEKLDESSPLKDKIELLKSIHLCQASPELPKAL